MRRRKLGASALEVSEICLGTMTWGEQNSEAEGHAQIAWALDHGINFIDTAEMYPIPPAQRTQGSTEKILGTWLGKNKGRRDKVIVASKIAGPGRREWIRNGNNRVTKETIPWALEDSLKRLQTDYLDLYQIHWPERYVPTFGAWQYDPSKEREATPILDQVEGMAAAIKAGKIRAYGLSNETAFGLCEFVRVAKQAGLPPPASVQNGYSLVNRLFDGDPAEASRQVNVPLLAYSPLAMGLLSDKYRNKPWQADARLQRFPDFGERYKRARVIAAAEEYHKVAAKHRVPLAGIALAFVVKRFFVASTIIGATSIKQLDQLSGFFDLKLSKEIENEIETINSAYPSPCAQ
jgi:aryl-alcohol dehydrogenase-like predicted oxidoreductase